MHNWAGEGSAMQCNAAATCAVTERQGQSQAAKFAENAGLQEAFETQSRLGNGRPGGALLGQYTAGDPRRGDGRRRKQAACLAGGGSVVHGVAVSSKFCRGRTARAGARGRRAAKPGSAGACNARRGGVRQRGWSAARSGRLSVLLLCAGCANLGISQRQRELRQSCGQRR